MSIKKESFFKHIIFTSRVSMIFVLSITLISIGIVLFSFFSLQKTVDLFQESIPGKIVLIPEHVCSIELQEFLEEKKKNEIIKDFKIVSKEEGLKKMNNLLGIEVTEIINENGTTKNPLPEIINLYFFAENHNVNFLESLQQDIELFKNIAYFQVPIDVTKINQYKSKILLGSSLFATIFFIISVLLIYNNIKLSLYSNRANIKTMQLVGATKSFIQFPFIQTSIWTGLASGLIAITILVPLWFTGCFFMPKLEILINHYEIIQFSLGIVLLGILIALFSTWFVLRELTSLKTDIYE